MSITKRKFIALTSASAAAAYLPWRFFGGVAYAFAQTPTTVPLFATNLRSIDTIGVAAPDLTPASRTTPSTSTNSRTLASVRP